MRTTCDVNPLRPALLVFIAVTVVMVAISAYAEVPYNATWTKTFGSVKTDEVNDVGVDQDGNVYVTGRTNGSLPGNTSAGAGDIFVAKYDPSGAKQWIRQLGTQFYDTSNAIAVCPDGTSYLAGYTQAAFAGNVYAGYDDIVLVKYDVDGNLVWLKEYGTSSTDRAYGVCTDLSGNIYVAGTTSGPLDGQVNHTGIDVFVTKFNPSGNRLWTRLFGNANTDEAKSVKVDAYGYIYIAGRTYGSIDGTGGGNRYRAYLAKLNPAGSVLWARYPAGWGDDIAYGLEIDGSGNIYICGDSQGGLDGTAAWEYDYFVVKYDADGNQLWALQEGDGQEDRSRGIIVAGQDVYVTGFTRGALHGNANTGGVDLFLAKYDTSGGHVWTKQAGSVNGDVAQGLSSLSGNEVFVGGYSDGNLEGNTNLGSYDAFIIKMSSAETDPGTDTQPPASSVTAPISGMVMPAALGNYTIRGTSTDGSGSGVDYVDVTTDGGTTWHKASGKDSWSYVWPLSSSGAYCIKSRATDNSGNLETPGPCVSVTVTGTPKTTIIRPMQFEAIPAALGNYSITGNTMDSNGTGIQKVEVSTDNGTTWSDATLYPPVGGGTGWSYKWEPLPLGSHSIKARGYDNSGYMEVPVTTVKVVVDGDLPNSSIVDPLSGKTLPPEVDIYVIRGTAADVGGAGTGIAYVDVSADGGNTWHRADGTAAWSYSWTLPADGTYTVISRATDKAGNVEAVGAGISVTLDKPPRSTLITPADNEAISAALPNYGITGTTLDRSGTGINKVEVSTDGGQVWSDAVDGLGDGTWSQWNFTWVAPLPLGNHTIKARGTDNSGSVESPSQDVRVLVDGDTPFSQVTVPGNDMFIIIPPGGYVISGTAADTGGAGVALVDVSTDGGLTWSAATGTELWSYTWAFPPDGTYNIISRATDRAGNAEVAGAGITVSVDNTPPASSTGNTADGAALRGTDYTFTGTADDYGGSGVVLVMVSTDGGASWNDTVDSAGDGSWSTWQYAWALPADGVYNLKTKALDAVGNEETPGAGISVTVDNTPPSTTFIVPADGAVITDASYAITGTSDDGVGSGIATVEVSTDGGSTWNALSGASPWNYDWAVPGVGGYSVIARATDNAGNTESPGASAGVSAKTVLSFDRAGITLNCNTGRPPATTKAHVSASPWSVQLTPSCTAAWLNATSIPPAAGGGLLITLDAASLTQGSHSGEVSVSSADAVNSPVSLPVDATVSSSALVSEQTHYIWNEVITGGNCSVCHSAPNAFLPAGFDMHDSQPVCLSCHNTASVAHNRGAMRGMHPMFVNVTSGGSHYPGYGNLTSAAADNRPYANLGGWDAVECATCHNPMGKAEDYGRVWEYTQTTDNTTYYLSGGGWANYGYVTPGVYISGTILTAPAYVRSREMYKVDPSEYTYDELAGSITFGSPRPAGSYVYVTLDYPYLRASAEDNRLCTDCHSESAHMGTNCLTCHTAHGTGNQSGIRDSVRTTTRSEAQVLFKNATGIQSFADADASYDGICEVCHTQTLYHKSDGSGAAHHGGEDCTACHTHASGFAR